MANELRPPPPPRRLAHSRIGAVSVLFAILSVAGATAMVLLTMNVYGEHGASGNQERLKAGLRAANFAALASAGLCLAGLASGVVACARPGGRKELAIIGLVINGLIGLLFAFGLVVILMAKR